MSTPPVRVLVVDDQALMRRGLARLLATEDGIEVMGEVGDGEEALALLAGLPEEQHPQVALVDIRMPVMDGITLIRRLGETYPGVATVILTTFQEDEYLFDGLRAGARGYLLKDAEPDEVADVLRRAARGERVLTGAVADRLVGALDGAPATPPVPEPAQQAAGPLSERETEVAQLISEGAANREIAERLFVTEGTVRNHVTNALRKLDLRDRTQLALWYTRERG
ncbi:response regulator transcription factor [Nocardiopsis sp. HNM0947]|uniref:Response regulator transcription factor n=1 Tax=Nocardiopsis coralli TaxID=2772213 RepID=A0ABR9P8C4_9ACTN|nr:response regulator transcription factor [Nocardiopsis coralli]MBE2999945.1 response regulator transcription factor [Nocardiopsis coralli]